MSKRIRTRFAPSPTGEMHVGSLRTALYNYLFAKQQDGDFVLRIEDTDRERFVEGASDRLLADLERFGIVPDESFKQAGEYGPYVQSERLDMYKNSVQELINSGHAYYAFDTAEELDQMRQEQQARKEPPKYDRRALQLSEDEVKAKLAAGEPYVVRMKVPEGQTTFTDMIRGDITIDNATVDDQILLKSDGYPTYHLAVVVDDHAMEITHIIRGEEWIPSTPKHVMLYQMFGWEAPAFVHLPLLTNEQKAKLSKRHGDVSVEDFLEKGILPQALLNFVALLGWNPGDDQEIFTLEELVKKFDIKKVQKGSAVFDRTKLAWMNGQYIKNLSSEKLAALAEPHLKKADYFNDAYDITSVVKLFQERMEYIPEIVEHTKFLYTMPEYNGEILIFKKSDKEKTQTALKEAIALLENVNITNTDSLRNDFDTKREEIELSRAEMFWPMRVAVSGSEQSPDVFDIIHILGRDESIRRLQSALEKITKM